jgi:hypothetical protein
LLPGKQKSRADSSHLCGVTLKKRENTVKMAICVVLTAGIMLLLAGCTFLSEEKVKLRDLDFTVLGEEMIPEELKAVLEERKSQPFQITYTDNQYLYICIGYGEQETGGYSIAVDALYLTETNICAGTSLLGPEPSEKSNKTPSYPYIVLKTEYMEQTVLFE